jgi:hypothetical protein
MKGIRIEAEHLFRFKFMICSGLLMLVFATVSANEKGDVAASENQVTISEFDFKRMVLEGNIDTLSYKPQLGKHLWTYPSGNDRDEFVIMRIPFSTGFEIRKHDNVGVGFQKRKAK